MSNIYEKEILNVILSENADEWLAIRLASILFDVLDYTYVDTIEELIEDGIGYEEYMDSLESWGCPHSKLKEYFKKNKYENVKFTKKCKELILKVIYNTSYSQCFNREDA